MKMVRIPNSLFSRSLRLDRICRMGRVKIEIKKLDNSNGRQATYSKRKLGILKKANELAILCDIDIVLLMFSPSGKASLCCEKHSIEEVIAKYARLPAQDRIRRKLECLEVLKKSFKKSDHEVNIPAFDGSSTSTTQELSNEMMQLQNRLSEMQGRLSCWTNLDMVNDTDVLGQMEDSLKESLRQIQRQKEKAGNQHFVKLEREAHEKVGNQHFVKLEREAHEKAGNQHFVKLESEAHNDLQLPFHVSEVPQLEDLSTWIPFIDMQHIAFPEEPKLPSQRDVGCSAGPSFAGSFGYMNMCKREDIMSCVPISQENSFQASSSQTMPFVPGGQCPYPYSLNMVGDDDKGFQQLLGIDTKPNPLSYDFDVRCQPAPGPVRDDAGSSHVLPMSCGDSLFGEHLSSQKVPRIPSPLPPSIYKRVANDPNRILCDLLNAPN